MELSRSQQLAQEYIANYARSRKNEVEQTIREILRMSSIELKTFEDAITKLNFHASIALHFHPDRLDPNMKSVAEALLEQGIYKSQFETFLSNGSVSAFSGGERDVWENKIVWRSVPNKRLNQ